MTITNKVDPNSLMLFYNVVSAGSLAKASDIIGIPKSTISRKLRLLESQLQVVLLKRGAQGIKLTEAGEAIMSHCQRIHCEVQLTEEIASEIMSEPTGKLRISMPRAFGAMAISRVIARVGNRFPRLTQEIFVTNDPINVGTDPFDIAIQVGHLGNDNVPSRLLTKLEHGFYASPEFLKDRPLPKTERDLANFPRILLSQYVGGHELWPEGLDDPDDPYLRATVSDVSTTMQLVTFGMGVSILPVKFCDALVERGELVRLLPDFPLPSFSAYASYLEHRHQPARLRAFMDALVEEFSTNW